MTRTLLLLVVGLLSLTGCASMAPAPDETGARYSGSFIFPQAVSFKECVPGGTQDFGSPGDEEYIYPSGKRNFKFHTDPNSDSPPLSVSAPAQSLPDGTKGQPLTLGVLGTATFIPAWIRADGTLDCDMLRRFHEDLGLKYKAWTPEGWSALIGVYVKDVVDYAVDVAARDTNWVALTTDGSVKEKWAQDSLLQIPGAVKAQTGQDFSYFRITGLLLQSPTLPADLQAAIVAAENQKTVARGETEAARERLNTVNVESAAANAFPGGPQAYYNYQLLKQAVDKGAVMPVPVGSPVIVNPGG